MEQIVFRAMLGMVKEPPRRERIYAGFNGTVKENSEREPWRVEKSYQKELHSVWPCLLSFLTNETIKHAVLACLGSRAISFSFGPLAELVPWTVPFLISYLLSFSLCFSTFASSRENKDVALSGLRLSQKFSHGEFTRARKKRSLGIN